MEKIGNQKIWSYFDSTPTSREATNPTIRGGPGHPINSYLELAKKVAELQFLNREHVLLFRGQPKDYQTTKRNSMFKASIFRHEGAKVPSESVLEKRFAALKSSETMLINAYAEESMVGIDRLRRYRLIRWSILQHYEVCPTPLLDVTHSPRIAASFGTHRNDGEEAFLYAFGVPNLSGAITASSEAGLQIIRLSSACPPDAVRPHIQEGYLVGEYPDISDYRQHSQYDYYEMDFGRRLIAKFRFNPKKFWQNKNYPPASELALYPKWRADPLRKITAKIREKIDKEFA